MVLEKNALLSAPKNRAQKIELPLKSPSAGLTMTSDEVTSAA